MTMDSACKWSPPSDGTALHRFMREAGYDNYKSLWRWSVESKEDFWSKVWDFCGVIGDRGGDVFRPGPDFPSSRFFPDARLNFAENLLRRRDESTAIVFRSETGDERSLTFKQLYDEVSRVKQALEAEGVQKGDRVAGWLPNMPEAVIAMLATASIGATWSSASPDFGVQGVLDRFGQIEPKVLFGVDGYWYNGKHIDCREKLREAAEKLPTLKRVVTVEYGDLSPHNESTYSFFKGQFEPAEITFTRFPFDHPLYILFSSGTTGTPKCIVHGAGGTLLQHLKELQLQSDVHKDDKVFYFTTCGWMMWNWLVSALACEATLLLFDGAPAHPDGEALFRYAEQHRCTLFGTSAKFIDALRTMGVRLVGKEYDLDCVRVMCSTGSPLSPEGFDYVYESLLPNVQLSSISGGTDIVSCFMLGVPVLPVHRGEIQGPGLGMDVDVFDEDGKSLSSGKGELVCKTPFPCMPVSFWNDPGGKKYASAYFEKFPGVWCHGDWCEWTPHGGLVIHGRSDATLNPGGVRIGTAEIYRIVENMPGVKECIAVGQDWQDDVRVVLFVVLKEGATLDEDAIKKAIRAGASPRHVPARIVPVADIPRTKSGKITEIAVREIIHGRPVKNIEALANPDALALYRDLEVLRR